MNTLRTGYYNQRDELIAKIPFWIFIFERGKAKAKGKNMGKGESITMLHPWTEEELKKIGEVLSEEIRGSNPRYWEDVKIGDELKPVVKGPLGLSDMISFLITNMPRRQWLNQWHMTLGTKTLLVNSPANQLDG